MSTNVEKEWHTHCILAPSSEVFEFLSPHMAGYYDAVLQSRWHEDAVEDPALVVAKFCSELNKVTIA